MGQANKRVIVDGDTGLPISLATSTKQNDLISRVGEVQVTPTPNTVLGRLKNIWDRMTDGTHIVKAYLYDAYGNPISSLGGGMSVHDADAHETIINHYLYQDLASYTLSAQANVGDYQITVTNATGFVIGSFIHITDTVTGNHEHELILVTNVVGNVLTLNRKLDLQFLVASTTVNRVARAMNVSGTVASPSIFKLEPSPNEVWHITSLSLTIRDDGVMDDAKFGGITALPNGIVLRKYNGSTYDTYFHIRSNNAFFRKCFDITYSDKAPAGTYGFRAKINFKNSSDSIIKLSNGERLELVIQDDLTGLVTMEMVAIGHIEGA